MKESREETQGLMSHFKDVLQRAGVKMTHQRIEIFKEVAKSGDHPDVETIFKGVRERMPTISQDTVYRTLWLYIGLGLITTLGTPEKRLRFDANTRQHHHFVCTRCGIAKDFCSKAFNNLKAPEAVKKFGSIETSNVEFRGLCADCLKKEQPASS